MTAGVATQPKRWTYDDYLGLLDDTRYEIIDGELLSMAPSPQSPHQDWSANLFRLLDAHVLAKRMGILRYAPLDVILDAENVVQPDLVFIKASRKDIFQKPGIMGAPDLVIEIVSPFSVRRDRQQKSQLYARFGVKEFWIVDPGNNGIEIFTLKSGAYELSSSAIATGKVRSQVLDLEFDVAEVAPQEE